MSLLDSISRWPKVSIAIYEKAIVNTAGIISSSWTKTATVEAFKYTASSGLTDEAGKLQIVESHVFVFDPEWVVNESEQTFNAENSLRFDYDGDQYFIDSKDDILSEETVYMFKGRKDGA